MKAIFLCLFFISAAVTQAEISARDALFARTVEDLFPEWVKIRRDIHQHPELSNEEKRTGALVAERLERLGLQVQRGVAGHGVVGILKSNKPGVCVAVRADMDALPIKELRSVPYRSQNPGVMHACGHDVHVTCALGLAELLAKHPDSWCGSVKFIFQPAEEAMPATFKGDWGAKLMVAEGVLENPKPVAIYGLHTTTQVQPVGNSDEEKMHYLSAGQLAYTPGIDNANSDRFHIVIHGKMAHGSAPHRGVDAIAVAAEAIMALQMIKSRQTSTRQPLVISIGTIQGGQRENIIAEKVELGGTVRTYDAAFRDGVIEQMHRILKGITEAHGASYEMDYRKTYPSIHNDRALVSATLPSFQRLFGNENVLEVIPGMGGEDFSFFAQVIPGFYFRLGVANEKAGITAGGHTPMYDCDEASILTGVRALAAAVCDHLDRASAH